MTMKAGYCFSIIPKMLQHSPITGRSLAGASRQVNRPNKLQKRESLEELGYELTTPRLFVARKSLSTEAASIRNMFSSNNITAQLQSWEKGKPWSGFLL